MQTIQLCRSLNKKSNVSAVAQKFYDFNHISSVVFVLKSIILSVLPLLSLVKYFPMMTKGFSTRRKQMKAAMMLRTKSAQKS